LEIWLQLRTFVALHVFSLGPHADLNLFSWKQHSRYCGHSLWFFLKKRHPSIHDFKERFTRVWNFHKLKRESTTSSSNKLGDKIFVPRLFTWYCKLCHLLKRNTKCRKQILKFIWKYCRNYCWNEIDDEILPVFAQFLWTLKFILSSSHGKLYFVLSQTTVLENAKRTQCNILKVTMVQGFVHYKFNQNRAQSSCFCKESHRNIQNTEGNWKCCNLLFTTYLKRNNRLKFFARSIQWPKPEAYHLIASAKTYWNICFLPSVQSDQKTCNVRISRS